MEIFSPSKGLACRGVFFMPYDALHALKCKSFMFLRVFALKCRNFLFWKVFAVTRTLKSLFYQNICESCTLVWVLPPCLTKNKIKRIINIKRQLVVESRFSSKIWIQKETVLPLRRFFSCRNYLRYVRISTTRVAKAIIRDNASKTVITSPPLARE